MKKLLLITLLLPGCVTMRRAKEMQVDGYLLGQGEAYKEMAETEKQWLNDYRLASESPIDKAADKALPETDRDLAPELRKLLRKQREEFKEIPIYRGFRDR